MGPPSFREKTSPLIVYAIRLGADFNFELAYDVSRFEGFNKEFGRYVSALK